MRVLQIYNRYRTTGHGEDRVVDQTVEVLRSGGVQVTTLEADSRTIERGLFRKVRAAATLAYSNTSYKRASDCITSTRPDVVHAHNLYPLLTPSVLRASLDAGVPTVVTAHNYFLTCPVYTHLSKGETCTRCVGGNELHCVTRNCRNNIVESVVYAARSMIVRRRRLIEDNCTLLIALSEFARRHLRNAGYAGDRIVVLPNAVPIPENQAMPSTGKYVAFGGRLTYSKGVDVLISAAHRTRLPTRIAGSIDDADTLLDTSPSNIKFLGPLARSALPDFYTNARFLVFPSRWFEMCPLMVLEAMSYGLPVIASGIGSMEELVLNNETGIICAPGDPIQLATAMRRLWESPSECERLGAAARRRIQSQYNEDGYFDRLTRVYNRAINSFTPRL
jgi:glycosyltransferase involved in cell wall biosynthesis